MLVQRSLLVSLACAGLATIAAGSPPARQHTAVVRRPPTLLAAGNRGAVPPDHQNIAADPPSYWLPFGTQSTAAFRQTVSADFNRDGFADVVVQRSTDLELCFGPAYFGVHLGPLASNVNDMAVLPGDPPCLITVGRDGLFKLEWDETSPGFWHSTMMEKDLWRDVRNVVIDPRSGHLHYFGVKYDSDAQISTVICIDPETSWTNTLFTLPYLVRDAQLLQYCDDDTPEIALMTGNRIIVYPAYSSPYLAITTTTTSPSHAFAPVHQVGGAFERVLWFNHVAQTGDEYLLSVNPTSTVIQASFGGLRPGVVACVRGDADGDRDEDLLFSQTSAQSLVILYNGPNSGEPSFNLTEAGMRTVPYSTGVIASALSNKAQPSWSDIDDDGDLDICFPVQEGSTVFVQESGQIAANGPHIVTNNGSGGTVMINPDGTSSFRWHLAAPDVTGASQLQVITWERKSDSVPTEPQYGPPLYFSSAGLVNGEKDFPNVQLPLPDSSARPVYFFLLRWVSTGGASAEPRFPARMYALQLGGTTWEAQYLQGLALNQVVWTVNYGGFPSGTVCEIARLPNLPADDPPRPRN